MKAKYTVTFVEKKRNLKTVLFILLLFISSVVIIVLVTRVNLRSNEIKIPKEEEICNSPECIRSAKEILSAMNTTVNPCDDFFSFTCGRWKENIINDNLIRNSDFTQTEETMSTSALKFLKSNGSLNDPVPLQKSRNMYRACIDQETRDKLRYKPVFKYLSLLDLPPIPRYFYMNATKDVYQFDWMKTDIAMNTLLNEQLFVNCYVVSNNLNNSKHSIYCDIPKKHLLGLESVPLSKKQTEKLMFALMNNSTKNKDAAHDFMKFCMSTLIEEKYSLTMTDDQLNMAINIIEKSENFLNMIKDMISNDDHYITIKIKDLQNYTTYHLNEIGIKSKLIWKQYLEQLFRYSNLSAEFENDDEITISSEYLIYYGAIAGFVSDESDVKLELWAWWRAVSHLLMHTTSDIMKHRDDLLDILGVKKPSITDSICGNITNNYMNHAISFALVDKSFLNKTKPEVQNMLQDIKEAVEFKINSLNWVDSRTKNLTTEKLKGLTDIEGILEWILDENNLESMYSNIPINTDTHLDNLVNHIKFRKKNNLNGLYWANKTFWNDEPIMINADHNLTQNYLTLPSAISNSKIYDRGLKALNYGSLGSIIAHELMYLIGKSGNLNQYDRNNTQSISALEKCFSDQYNSFNTSADEFINTEKSLNEYIADNRGLSLAYLAYQNYKKRNGEEMKLQGMEEYTHDQLFFISYANIRCNEMKSRYSKRNLEIDHTAQSYGVLGAIFNSEEFSEAFKCTLESNMNYIKPKCKIW